MLVRLNLGPWFFYLLSWCSSDLEFGLQKWSKGKQKEKVNNAVLFDQANYDKMLSEVPKYKQITPSVLSERLRVKDLDLIWFIHSMLKKLLRILQHPLFWK